MPATGIKGPMQRVMVPRTMEIVPFQVGKLTLACFRRPLEVQLKELGLDIRDEDRRRFAVWKLEMGDTLSKVDTLDPTTSIDDAEVDRLAPPYLGDRPGLCALLGAIRANPGLASSFQLGVRGIIIPKMGSGKFVAVVHERVLHILPAHERVWKRGAKIIHSISR